jgi:signal transduction histidine kinase
MKGELVLRQFHAPSAHSLGSQAWLHENLGEKPPGLLPDRVRRTAWLVLRFNLFVVVPLTLLLFAVAPLQTTERFWRIAILVAVVANVNFVALTLIYRNVWRRLAHNSYFDYVVLGIVALPLVAIATGVVSHFLLLRFPRLEVPPLPELLQINIVIVVIAGTSLFILRDYRRRLVGVSAHLETMENSRFELERERDELKLFALQVFLKPHFLFNSLNAIAALIHEDPEKAESMTLALARVLRKILEIRERVLIPLREELAIACDYLAVEKIRLGDRLTYEIQAPEDLLAAQVPALTVQPLVENAVQHGVRQRLGGGYVHLRVSAGDGMCHIEIADNGPGVSSHRGSGQACSLLHERLSKLYREKYDLSLQRDTARGETIAVLSIPLRMESQRT